MIRLFIMIVTLSFLTHPAHGAPSERHPQVGDIYELEQSYKTASRSNTDSTSSSSGRTVIIERVIGVRDDGWELEYDLPQDSTPEERAREWQFPARVFKPFQGAVQLLNAAELEQRVDQWLKAAEWTREICGRWIFTWNAFRIDCDPQSVLETIEAYDLELRDLYDGATHEPAGAIGQVVLSKVSEGAEGALYAGKAALDPEAMREDAAHTALVVAEISGETLTLEDALRTQSDIHYSGTITVTFEADPSGFIRQRTTVTDLDVKGPDELEETRTATTTLEKRLISSE